MLRVVCAERYSQISIIQPREQERDVYPIGFRFLNGQRTSTFEYVCLTFQLRENKNARMKNRELVCQFYD